MTTPCAQCGKQFVDIKACSKCHVEFYCSRDCQKAHWKTHKKACAKLAEERNNKEKATQEKYKIDKPFHQLHERKWLHNRPQDDTYKLVIDCFRMQMADALKFDGLIHSGDVRGGAKSSLPEFKKWLQLAKDARGVLPAWWNDEKESECIALGSMSGWSSLEKSIEKSDIMEEYGMSDMPMQLRLLGEQISGRGPGGQSGTAMMQMQMQIEQGGKHAATLDMSRMF
jgi:splicing suppressor protein 51